MFTESPHEFYPRKRHRGMVGAQPCAQVLFLIHPAGLFHKDWLVVVRCSFDTQIEFTVSTLWDWPRLRQARNFLWDGSMLSLPLTASQTRFSWPCLTILFDFHCLESAILLQSYSSNRSLEKFVSHGDLRPPNINSKKVLSPTKVLGFEQRSRNLGVTDDTIHEVTIVILRFASGLCPTSPWYPKTTNSAFHRRGPGYQHLVNDLVSLLPFFILRDNRLLQVIPAPYPPQSVKFITDDIALIPWQIEV